MEFIIEDDVYEVLVKYFGGDIIIPAINIRLDKDPHKYEVLFRTLTQAGVSRLVEGDGFKVVEEIVDPIKIEVNLLTTELEPEGVALREPNWQIDIRQNNSIPSGLKSYNDILSYNITSSFQQLLSKLHDDSNVQEDNSDTYEYHGQIPWSKIKI